MIAKKKMKISFAPQCIKYSPNCSKMQFITRSRKLRTNQVTGDFKGVRSVRLGGKGVPSSSLVLFMEIVYTSPAASIVLAACQNRYLESKYIAIFVDNIIIYADEMRYSLPSTIQY